ncbi:MAG: sialidase family protein, partial [Actinomycetota bacterium]
MGLTSTGRIFYKAQEFYQLPGGGSRAGIVAPVIRSTDGGSSWQRAAPLQRGQVISDPYLYVDPSTDRVFSADLQENLCGSVSLSDDDGNSWITNPQVCGETDHETVFAGPSVTSITVGYPNIVYYCAINGGATNLGAAAGCLKSLDGGVTYAPTGELAYPARQDESEGPGSYCVGATGHGVVGPDGTVYLPKGWCGQPYLAISHDEGMTWSRVQVATNGLPL